MPCAPWPKQVGIQRALIVRKVLRFRGAVSICTWFRNLKEPQMLCYKLKKPDALLLRRKDGVCIAGGAHLHCKKICTVKEVKIGQSHCQYLVVEPSLILDN
jgi:hypothetical protein